ncbi:C2 family cysteine protease [Jiangella muralis]|uniref:C2 family cysteine protease n=1 Tax=Jiangella muralis TaxID=702383 RepID=UPI00069E7C0C|nr:C2 family cysteine protease [Jiangella muralis]
MAERPIRAAVQALTLLRAGVGAEFEAVRAATAGRAEGVARAVGVDGARPAAELARSITAAVDDAAGAVRHRLDAEVAGLLALLHPAPRPGPPPGLPAPVPPFPTPGLATEPALTDGVRYAAHPLTLPAAVGTEFAGQGAISDCHLVAALCTVAERAPWLLPAVTAAGDAVLVDVPGRRYRLHPTLPVDDADGGFAYARSPDGSTLVPYVEKAFAVYGGGYPALAGGGLPAEALYWLTGRPSYLLRVPKADDDIVAALAESGQPAVACSRPFDDGDDAGAAAALRYHLAPVAHAYAVRGLDTERRVLLHNPWGRRHPRPVPLDVFRRLFTRIDWCEADDDG